MAAFAGLSLSIPLPESADTFCNPAGTEDSHRTSLNAAIFSLQRSQSSGTKGVFSALLSTTMGPYLTHEDPKIRERGTLLLAELLNRLPDLDLGDANSLRHILKFFCARLADYPSVAPSLQALLAIAKRHGDKVAQAGEAVEVSLSVLKELPLHRAPQSMRSLGLELLVALWEHPASLSRIAQSALDLSTALVTATEGEKDPRCLIPLLRCVQLIASAPTRCAKLQHAGDAAAMSSAKELEERSAEQLFGLIAVYYPITFNPAPGTKNIVTPEQLKSGLNSALTSTLAFGPHLLPLLLDKLDSSVRSNKEAALITLPDAVKIFGVPVIERHLVQIAEALQEEVIMGGDAELSTLALKALKIIAAIVARFTEQSSSTAPGSHTPWSLFCNAALGSSGGTSAGSSTILGRAHSKVLAALASSSTLGLREALSRSCDSLVYAALMIPKNYKGGGGGGGMEIEPVGGRAAAESAVTSLRYLAEAVDRDVDYYPHPMTPYVDRFLAAFSAVLDRSGKDPETISASVEAAAGLSALITHTPSPLVKIEQVQQAIRVLVGVYLHVNLQKGDGRVSAAVVTALVDIGARRKEYADLLLKDCIPQLGRVTHQLSHATHTNNETPASEDNITLSTNRSATSTNGEKESHSNMQVDNSQSTGCCKNHANTEDTSSKVGISHVHMGCKCHGTHDHTDSTSATSSDAGPKEYSSTLFRNSSAAYIACSKEHTNTCAHTSTKAHDKEDTSSMQEMQCSEKHAESCTNTCNKHTSTDSYTFTKGLNKEEACSMLESVLEALTSLCRVPGVFGEVAPAMLECAVHVDSETHVPTLLSGRGAELALSSLSVAVTTTATISNACNTTTSRMETSDSDEDRSNTDARASQDLKDLLAFAFGAPVGQPLRQMNWISETGLPALLRALVNLHDAAGPGVISSIGGTLSGLLLVLQNRFVQGMLLSSIVNGFIQHRHVNTSEVIHSEISMSEKMDVVSESGLTFPLRLLPILVSALEVARVDAKLTLSYTCICRNRNPVDSSVSIHEQSSVCCPIHSSNIDTSDRKDGNNIDGSSEGWLQLLSCLLDIAVNEQHGPVPTEAASRCVAAILSKLAPGEPLTKGSVMVEQATSSSSVTASNSCPFGLLVWASRGLSMRGSAAEPYRRKMLTHTAQEAIRMDNSVDTNTGISLGTIVAEPPALYVGRCSPLWRHRAFEDMWPIIASACPSPKAVLAALQLIGHVPPMSITREQAITIGSAASVALSSPVQDVKLSALAVLGPLLANGTLLEAMEQHANTLALRLTELSTGAPLARQRAQALQCLLILAKLPYARLHPLKAEVCRGLHKALDDPRRAVRQAAVKARNAWLLLGAPV